MKYDELIKKLKSHNTKWRHAVSISSKDKDIISEESIEIALNILEQKIKERIDKGYKISNVKFINKLFDYDYGINIGFFSDQKIDFERFDEFVFNVMETASKRECENAYLKEQNAKLMLEISFMKWMNMVKKQVYETEACFKIGFDLDNKDDVFREYFNDDYEPLDVANIIINNIKKRTNYESKDYSSAFKNENVEKRYQDSI